MKVKRQKHVRKVLTFYKTNFGIEAPYSILVDGTYCKAALKFKVNINEQLPKYLDSEVRILTTKCVLAECEAFGTLLYGPLKILRQFECLNCGHDPAQPAVDCMKKQAKKKHKKYIMATQDRELSELIRKRSGVPLLFISHNAINLENPSDTSKQAADGALNTRLVSSKEEHNKLLALKREAFGEPEFRKKKRKGPKGPNPLSCRKKKAKNSGGASLPKAKKKKKQKQLVV